MSWLNNVLIWESRAWWAFWGRYQDLKPGGPGVQCRGRGLACFGGWVPGKIMGLVTEIGDLEGREDCEGLMNSVFGLLSLRFKCTLCRCREVRRKLALEVGIGDAGLGVIDHDFSVCFKFLQ